MFQAGHPDLLAIVSTSHSRLHDGGDIWHKPDPAPVMGDEQSLEHSRISFLPRACDALDLVVPIQDQMRLDPPERVELRIDVLHRLAMLQIS